MNFFTPIRTLARSLAMSVAVAAPLLASTLVFSPAAAQTAGEQTVPLTPQIVENFIASMSDVKTVTDEIREQNNVPDDTNSMTAYLNYQGAMGRLDNAVQAHGFDSFMSWLPVMSSVTTAYTFAEQGGDMDDQMSNAIAQIKANDSLTDQQKDMMIKQMEAAATSIGAIRPRQQNIDAVAPYTEQLEELFDNM